MTKAKRRSNIPEISRMPMEAGAAARRSRRTRLRLGIPAGAATLATIAAVGACFWPHHQGPTPPTPVALVDSNHRACILSEPADPSLGIVNSGFQQAAQAAGNVNVQNYTIPTPSTDAVSYLAGMINDKCMVILTLGTEPNAAADAYAENNPKTILKLVTVGGQTSTSNVITALPIQGLTAQTISTLIRSDFS